MSAETEEIAVFEFVKDRWPSDSFGPMQYPNHDETSASPSVQYASVVIIPNEGARIRNSIGAPRLIRNYGFIFFTLYMPKSGGTRGLTKAKDFLTDLFDDRVFLLEDNERTVCGISSFQTLGLKDNLYRMTVSVPFHRDEWKQ